MNLVPPTTHTGSLFSATDTTSCVGPHHTSVMTATAVDNTPANKLNNTAGESKGNKGSRVLARPGIHEQEMILNRDHKRSAVLTKNNKSVKLMDDRPNDVGPFDVLYVGRGGIDKVLKKKEYSGYIWYRSMIQLVRPGYLMCYGKTEKMKLSRWIVSKVRECGGRFLEKDKKTGLYEDIGDSVAQMRTSMSLRDRRLWKTCVQAHANDSDHYGKFHPTKNLTLADVFRECEIYSPKFLQPSHQSPFANKNMQFTHAGGVIPSIIPSASMGSMVYSAPPIIGNLTAHLPIVPVSLVSTPVPTFVISAPMAAGAGAIKPPTGLTSSTFGATSLVQQTQRLMMEKQQLEQEIIKDHQTMVRRQERLARLESEQQQLKLQQECIIRGGELQRCMMERQMIRQKIREEMRMQEELDARMMRREMEGRVMLQGSIQGTLQNPVRQQWSMRQNPMGPHAPQKHQLSQIQSYRPTSKPRIPREEARKPKEAEEKKRQVPDGPRIEDLVSSDCDEESEDGSDIVI
jgi:hypothetical protein